MDVLRAMQETLRTLPPESEEAKELTLTIDAALKFIADVSKIGVGDGT